MRAVLIVLSLVAALGGGGCGGAPGSRPDPSIEPAGTSETSRVPSAAIAEQLPRVEYLGGPFLRSPRLVTVTFVNEDPEIAARLKDFGDAITRTHWWREAVAGYCASPDDCIDTGLPGKHVGLDRRLPTQVHDVMIEQLLTRLVETGGLGSIDENTLLLAYLPRGVVLREAALGRYCVDGGPRAYHRSLELSSGHEIPYAVMARCGDLDQLTTTASHEILEATTNPNPADRGFAFLGGSDSAGFTAAGVEPADPCGLIARGDLAAGESGYAVQRVWSNEAAAAGTHPCAPGPQRPYLALLPETPTVRLPEVGGRTVMMLEAAANGDVTRWNVAATDLSAPPGCVALRLDRPTVSSGQQIRLRINLLRPGTNDLCLVGLESTHKGHTDVWPLAVSTR